MFKFSEATKGDVSLKVECTVFDLQSILQALEYAIIKLEDDRESDPQRFDIMGKIGRLKDAWMNMWEIQRTLDAREKELGRDPIFFSNFEEANAAYDRYMKRAVEGPAKTA